MDFPIRIVIDDSDAASGIRRVGARISSLTAQAQALGSALERAVTRVRPNTSLEQAFSRLDPARLRTQAVALDGLFRVEQMRARGLVTVERDLALAQRATTSTLIARTKAVQQAELADRRFATAVIARKAREVSLGLGRNRASSAVTARFDRPIAKSVFDARAAAEVAAFTSAQRTAARDKIATESYEAPESRFANSIIRDRIDSDVASARNRAAMAKLNVESVTQATKDLQVYKRELTSVDREISRIEKARDKNSSSKLFDPMRDDDLLRQVTPLLDRQRTLRDQLASRPGKGALEAVKKSAASAADELKRTESEAARLIRTLEAMNKERQKVRDAFTGTAAQQAAIRAGLAPEVLARLPAVASATYDVRSLGSFNGQALSAQASVQQAAALERSQFEAAQRSFRLQSQAFDPNAGPTRQGILEQTAFAAALERSRGVGDKAKLSIEKLEQSTERYGRTLSRVGRLGGDALGVFTIGLGIREFISLADGYAEITNRLRTVTTTSDQLAESQQRLFTIAREARTGIKDTVEIFARSASALRARGVGDEALLGLTKTATQAVTLSGSNPIEGRNALRQFSQAISSNRLGGDELRSIVEQAPVLADIVAEYIGSTRGELRKLASDGRLTSQVMLDAFLSAADSIDERFNKLSPTIGQSLVVLGNSVLRLFGDINDNTGVFSGLASGILSAADNMGLLVTAAGGLGAVYAGRAAQAGFNRFQVFLNAIPVGSQLARREMLLLEAGMAASVAKTRALSLVQNVASASFSRTALAVSTASLALSAFNRVGSVLGSVSNLLGGPIALAVTAATAGMLLFSTRARAAEEALADALDNTRDLVTDVELLASKDLSNLAKADLNFSIGTAQDSLKKQLTDAFAPLDELQRNVQLEAFDSFAQAFSGRGAVAGDGQLPSQLVSLKDAAIALNTPLKDVLQVLDTFAAKGGDYSDAARKIAEGIRRAGDNPRSALELEGELRKRQAALRIGTKDQKPDDIDLLAYDQRIEKQKELDALLAQASTNAPKAFRDLIATSELTDALKPIRDARALLVDFPVLLGTTVDQLLQLDAAEAEIRKNLDPATKAQERMTQARIEARQALVDFQDAANNAQLSSEDRAVAALAKDYVELVSRLNFASASQEELTAASVAYEAQLKKLLPAVYASSDSFLDANSRLREYVASGEASRTSELERRVAAEREQFDALARSMEGVVDGQLLAGVAAIELSKRIASIETEAAREDNEALARTLFDTRTALADFQRQAAESGLSAQDRQVADLTRSYLELVGRIDAAGGSQEDLNTASTAYQTLLKSLVPDTDRLATALDRVNQFAASAASRLQALSSLAPDAFAAETRAKEVSSVRDAFASERLGLKDQLSVGGRLSIDSYAAQLQQLDVAEKEALDRVSGAFEARQRAADATEKARNSATGFIQDVKNRGLADVDRQIAQELARANDIIAALPEGDTLIAGVEGARDAAVQRILKEAQDRAAKRDGKGNKKEKEDKDPLGDEKARLERAMRLLGIDDRVERDVEQRVLALRDKLAEAGKDPAAAESLRGGIRDERLAELRDGIDAATELNNQIERERELLGLTSQQADVRNKIYEVEQRLREQGLDISGREREDLIKRLDDLAELTSYMEAVRAAGESVANTLTESILTFARTGKLSVRDMADSIISDLARIVLQATVTTPLANAIMGFGSIAANTLLGGNSLVGTASAAPSSMDFMPVPRPRERGGPVFRGQSYIVGERRPELFTPAVNGNIGPVMKSGLTESGNISIGKIEVNGAPGQDPQQIAQAVMVAMRSEIDARSARVARLTIKDQERRR